MHQEQITRTTISFCVDWSEVYMNPKSMLFSSKLMFFFDPPENLSEATELIATHHHFTAQGS